MEIAIVLGWVVVLGIVWKYEHKWSGKMSIADQIIAYENGELTYEQVVELFQRLVDSGLAWKLQGAYGREAIRLIEAGEVVA